MALPALATIEELAAWLGDPIDDVERGDAILNAASTLIRSRTGRVWVDAAGTADADLTEVNLAAVRTVTVLVASRCWRNPDGRISETLGPYSERLADWAGAGLTLTEEEMRMLAVTSTGTGIPGLTSIRVVAPSDTRMGYYDDDADDLVS